MAVDKVDVFISVRKIEGDKRNWPIDKKRKKRTMPS